MLTAPPPPPPSSTPARRSTNGNLITSWAQRTQPTHYKFGDGDQVPWEIIFKLANTLNIPPGINIPAHADDD